MEQKIDTLFQVRLYDIQDELFFKEAFLTDSAAQSFAIAALRDRAQGHLFARATLRHLSAGRRGWAGYEVLEGPHALLRGEQWAPADLWRVNYYDIGDTLCHSDFSDGPVTDEWARAQAEAHGAYYCVVACRRAGEGKAGFFIQRHITHRRYKRLDRRYRCARPCLEDAYPALGRRFGRALREDEAETLTMRRRLEEAKKRG